MKIILVLLVMTLVKIAQDLLKKKIIKNALNAKKIIFLKMVIVYHIVQMAILKKIMNAINVIIIFA